MMLLINNLLFKFSVSIVFNILNSSLLGSINLGKKLISLLIIWKKPKLIKRLREINGGKNSCL